MLSIADVQLTRDLVPIIYHDFSLSESGTDIAIHDLSFDQVSTSHPAHVSHSNLKFSSLHTRASSNPQSTSQYACRRNPDHGR